MTRLKEKIRFYLQWTSFSMEMKVKLFDTFLVGKDWDQDGQEGGKGGGAGICLSCP